MDVALSRALSHVARVRCFGDAGTPPGGGGTGAPPPPPPPSPSWRRPDTPPPPPPTEPPEPPEPPPPPEPRRRGFLGSLALIDWLLKHQAHVFEDILAEREVGRYLVDSIVVTIVGSVFYGFVVGISIGGWQVLYDPVKMPWVLLFTLALCLPSLYIFSSYAGSRLTLGQTAAVASTATAVVATILIGFAPVTWFFMFTAPGSHHFAVLINVLVFAIAGFFGLQFLFRAAHAVGPAGDEPNPIERVLVWWVLLYGAVGAQMAWLLRPFFNQTDVFIRPRSGNFFVAVLQTLWEFLSGQGW